MTIPALILMTTAFSFAFYDLWTTCTREYMMKITGLILLTVAFSLAFYDLWTGFTRGSETTISWVIYTTSLDYPAVPFLSGFLCGHLFASMRSVPYAKKGDAAIGQDDDPADLRPVR